MGYALTFTLAAAICFGLIRNEVIATLAGSLLYLVLWIPLMWVTAPLFSSGRVTRFEVFLPSAFTAFELLLWPLLHFAALAFGFASSRHPWLRVTLAWFLATLLQSGAWLALGVGVRDAPKWFGPPVLELVLLWAGLQIVDAGRGKLARWPAALILWAGGLAIAMLLMPGQRLCGPRVETLGSCLATAVAQGRLTDLPEVLAYSWRFDWETRSWRSDTWETRSQAGMLSIGALLLLAQVAGLWVLIYRMWGAIQDGHARTSPGKALGFLFIPIFNLYWAFQVFWGFARDFNAYLDRHGLPTRSLSGGLLLAYPILAIVSLPLMRFTAPTTAHVENLVVAVVWLVSAAVGAAVTGAVNEAARNEAAGRTSAAPASTG